jgi:hypothetical protein
MLYAILIRIRYGLITLTPARDAHAQMVSAFPR